MVVGYHLILTHYGFWLPNDPRGSWSEFVRAWELQAFGPATKTIERRSLAARVHDRAKRSAAKKALARDAVELTGEQARAVAMGFGDYARRSGLAIVAASVLPKHSHLVVGRMGHDAEQTANLLKGSGTAELHRRGLHPFAGQPYRNGKLPSPRARGQWACFLNGDADVRRAIAYVENHPIKDGKPAQTWSFVTPYVDLQTLGAPV